MLIERLNKMNIFRFERRNPGIHLGMNECHLCVLSEL